MDQLVEEVRAARALPPHDLARAIRKAAGVSQVRMARELGVHRMTLGKWENGTRRPRGVLRSTYARLLEELREAGGGAVTITIADLWSRPTWTVPEAAQVYGVSRDAAYEAVKRGEIPSLRIGHRIVIPSRIVARQLGFTDSELDTDEQP